MDVFVRDRVGGGTTRVSVSSAGTQGNSNIRHHLARFRRRSKVTSRARHMVDGALRLLCHLRQPENFLPLRGSFLSIFG